MFDYTIGTTKKSVWVADLGEIYGFEPKIYKFRWSVTCNGKCSLVEIKSNSKYTCYKPKSIEEFERILCETINILKQGYRLQKIEDLKQDFK